MTAPRPAIESFTFEWDGGAVTSALRKEMEGRLVEMVAVVHKRAIELISPSTRSLGPSREGEPPHSDEGGLRQSTKSEVDRKALVGRVGTNDIKGLWMEVGRQGRGRIYGRRGFILIRVTEQQADRVTAGGIRKGRGARRNNRRSGVIMFRGKTYLVRAWSTHVLMRPRPWLSRALHESQMELVRIGGRQLKPQQFDSGPGPTQGLVGPMP